MSDDEPTDLRAWAPARLRRQERRDAAEAFGRRLWPDAYPGDEHEHEEEPDGPDAA